VTEPFDPRTKLIQLPRRVKDPQTGQWVTRQDEYLEVKWRLVWFREKYPHGRILTEEMCIDLDQGYARFRATVEDGEGGKATGTGTELRKSFEDYVEKAETRSIGRALAALGIGTQFVGEELSEGEHVADAPVPGGEHSEKSMPDRSGSARSAKSLDDAPTTVVHPTADEISTLVDSARAANVDLEAFGHDMRRLMQLPATQKITKKFLREQMTVEQYNQARQAYGDRLAAILEEDVPDHQPMEVLDGNAATETPVSEPTPPTSEEPPPAVPPSADESSSVASDDPDAAERERIIQEAITLGVGESEAGYIASKHGLKAAHALLLKAAKRTSKVA
jgi:hypothetical protein